MLYTNDFEDDFQLMFNPDGASFPFRHAHIGEVPHVYRLATRLQDSVLLQAGVSQYDDQGRLGESVEVYLPSFLRKLNDYRIKSACGKPCGQVFLSKSAFMELCEKAIQPHDSASQPIALEADDPHEKYFEYGVRESLTELREAHRSMSLIVPFDELGIRFHHEWGQASFEPKAAEYFTHRTLYGTHFFHLPSPMANLRERLTIDHVVSPHRGFETYVQPGEMDTKCSYLFITNTSDSPVNSAFFGRSSSFLVLDVFEYQSRTQATLLRLPEDTIDFFRSMHMNRLDELVAEARDHFSLRLAASSANLAMTDENCPVEDPFFWGTWKSVLPPLSNPPSQKVLLPRSAYSDLVEWTTRRRRDVSNSLS